VVGGFVDRKEQPRGVVHLRAVTQWDAHEPSVPNARYAVGKVTKNDEQRPKRIRWTATPEQRATKDALRRAALRDEPSILGKRCPEAQIRLFDFSIELREGLRIRRGGLQSASETTLACVQEEYRTRSSPLELVAFTELHTSRLWAIRALSLVTSSHAHSKRFELKITDGHPLTVCGGTGPWYPEVAGFRKTHPVSTFWGEELHVPALGCHTIIPESTRSRGVMWKYWCENCAPNAGAQTRAQVRAHRRRVENWASERLRERSEGR
jgi:hypothetical protein